MGNQTERADNGACGADPRPVSASFDPAPAPPCDCGEPAAFGALCVECDEIAREQEAEERMRDHMARGFGRCVIYDERD